MQLTYLGMANAKIIVDSWWLSLRLFNISGFISNLIGFINDDGSNHLLNLWVEVSLVART